MFKKNFIIPSFFARTRRISYPRRVYFRLICLLFMLGFSGCQTIPTLPPVDLTGPGWRIQQGQVIWRNRKDAPELTGELLVAGNPDGRSFVQFTKTPLPFIVAQTTSNSWQIHFVPIDKTYSAHGNPPARLIWLYLPRCLAGAPPPKHWKQERLENDGFRFENSATGELLEGYLNP